jgi:hypothetical protein
MPLSPKTFTVQERRRRRKTNKANKATASLSQVQRMEAGGRKTRLSRRPQQLPPHMQQIRRRRDWLRCWFQSPRRIGR